MEDEIEAVGGMVEERDVVETEVSGDAVVVVV